MSMDVADAYRHCAAVTRVRAGNFFYGIRLLPGDKRAALCAVYAFARRVDDVGDGDLPQARKLEELEAARRSLEATGAPTDPVLLALSDTRRRYPIRTDDLADLIDGVEMDVRGGTYRTVSELLLYCRRVASSVGRLCVAVFGPHDPDAATEPADALGVAMQLTNILRDVVEDLERGRVYLPADDLERFGCRDLADPDPEAFAGLVRFEAARARDWYARGLELVPLLDRRSASCVCAMAGIYGRLLDRIEREPLAVLRERVSLPPWEKAWVAVRSLRGRAA